MNDDDNKKNIERRLRKAISVAEQYKSKFKLEQEINKELAKRIDKLKNDNNEKQYQLMKYEELYNNIRNKLNDGYNITINDLIQINDSSTTIDTNTTTTTTSTTTTTTNNNNNENENNNDSINKDDNNIFNNIESDFLNESVSKFSLSSSHNFDNFIINNRKSWNQNENDNNNDNNNNDNNNDNNIKPVKGKFLGYEHLARSFDSKRDNENKSSLSAADSDDEDDDEDEVDINEIEIPIFEHFLFIGPEESNIKDNYSIENIISMMKSPMSPNESSFKNVKSKISSVINNAFSGKKIRDNDNFESHQKSLDSTILYHFPKSCEPPSPELYDFSLPIGSKITSLGNHFDKEVLTTELLHGSSQTQRSSKCFFFVLEDKTLPEQHDNKYSNIGLDSNRLFGICVLYSRLIPNNNNDNNDIGLFDYEVTVSYCFITRFPIFDFFFKVIFDMITMERIDRMESISQSKVESYKYIPTNTFDEILVNLLRLKPPSYGSTYSFQSHPAIGISTYKRNSPPLNYEEYLQNAADWSLPVLLSWMPIETILIAVGFLLCEVKLIVLGDEPGIVTSGVFGLLSLLRPLIWVSPIIPVLPTKYLDLIESPVPIIAGLVTESKSKAFNAETILKKCCASGNYSLTAVFDTINREIYISQDNYISKEEFILPQINILLEKLHSNIVEKKHFLRKEEPFYNYTVNQEKYSKSVQEIIQCHVEQILNLCLSKNIEVSHQDLSSSIESYSKLIEEKLQCEYIVTNSTTTTSALKDLPDSQKRSILSLASKFLSPSKVESSDNDNNIYNYDINSFIGHLTGTQQYMQFNK